ncbi:very short patch repair endonuclease [Jiangella muralis]|uniref:very short patch repair endonuclease n=1 Tax=Jiangella muralis TaxID=702383 RepID=UPI0009F85509
MPTSEHVQGRFRAQARRDTSPEMALRRELHRRGLRYRVQRRLLPGVRRTADIVFGPAKVVVDVRGCWWHACPEHGTTARHNADWWRQKLARNVARDAETESALRAAGWEVIVVWEHENPSDAAARVAVLVRQRNAM